MQVQQDLRDQLIWDNGLENLVVNCLSVRLAVEDAVLDCEPLEVPPEPVAWELPRQAPAFLDMRLDLRDDGVCVL